MTDVAFDAQASDVDGSFSLTNSDAGNAILVAVRDSSGGSAITSVTYGAVSLTKLGFIGSHNGSDGVALWGKIGGLPTGANTLIANNSPQWSGACTYKNPGSFGTVFTSFNPDSGGDTSGSVVITGTVTGGFCVSGTAFGASNSPIATSPATLRWVEAADSNSGSGNGWMIDKVSAGGGASTTIAWTNTIADWSGVIGVEVKPASGGVTSTGAVKLKKMVVAGSSAEKSVATGAVKLKKMKVVAVSGNASFVTGAVKLKKMVVAGSSAEKTIGTGAVKLKKMKVVGSSAEKTVATGAVKLKKMKTGVVNTHPFATAIAGSGTGQHFVDQFGHPFFLRADTVWGLPQMAGLNGGATTWNSDIDGYCSTRSAQGFNGFLINAVGNDISSSGGGSNNGDTWDGVAPFDSPGVLNETYWQRVDYIINQAATNGLTVVVNIAMQYSMDTTGCAFDSWTDANYEAYGTAIGTRYASALNIIWTVADDYFGNMDSFYTDIKTNIQSAGDTHLWSIENFAESTSRYDISNDTELTWGSTSGIDYNYIYSYGPSYLGIEYAYQESSPICVIHGDGYYDGDAGGSELKFLRNFVWWTLSDATRGFIYGRENVWSWSSSALGHLTDGLFDASGLQTAWNAFTSLPGWHTLVPDLSSSLVTAGRGTRATQIASGGGGHEYVPGDTPNTYVTASLAPDGSLAVVYIPAANSTTITVDDTKLASGYTAKWLDPANGATTSATTGSTYTRSTANSAGDHDWVLVFSELTSSVGTGAVKLKKMVVAGSSTEKSVATGAVKLKKMVVSGSSAEKSVATGVIRLKKMVISGSSSEKTIASGAVKLKKMVVSSSSAEKTIGSVAVNLKKMKVSASSIPRTSFSGAVKLKKMVVAGSSVEKTIASGSIHLKKMRVSSSSQEKTVASGNIHLHKMRVSISAVTGVQSNHTSSLFIFSPL